MKYNKIGFLKILMVCACIIAIYGAQAQTIKSDFAPGMQLFRIENHNSPEGKYAYLQCNTLIVRGKCLNLQNFICCKKAIQAYHWLMAIMRCPAAMKLAFHPIRST